MAFEREAGVLGSLGLSYHLFFRLPYERLLAVYHSNELKPFDEN